MLRMERNEHHVWWERRQYRTELEKTLRKHRGFVVPINVLDHQALHSELDPGPPKPNSLQTKALLHRIGDFVLQRGAQTLYVEQAVAFFYESAEADSPLGVNAEEIAQHLEQQLTFIKGEYNELGEISGRE